MTSTIPGLTVPTSSTGIRAASGPSTQQRCRRVAARAVRCSGRARVTAWLPVPARPAARDQPAARPLGPARRGGMDAEFNGGLASMALAVAVRGRAGISEPTAAKVTRAHLARTASSACSPVHTVPTGADQHPVPHTTMSVPGRGDRAGLGKPRRSSPSTPTRAVPAPRPPTGKDSSAWSPRSTWAAPGWSRVWRSHGSPATTPTGADCRRSAPCRAPLICNQDRLSSSDANFNEPGSSTPAQGAAVGEPTRSR